MTERRMRVLELLQPPDGGVAEHVLRLTEGLTARGHEVTVAGPGDAAIRAPVERDGARYAPLPIVAALPALRDDAASLRSLGALVRRGGFDLLHAHAQKAGLLGRPVARAAAIPALYSPHSLVYRTQPLRPRPGRRVRYVLNRGVERALGRATATIVACAEDERRAAIDDGLVPEDRVTKVLYGVAPDLDAVPHPGLAGVSGDGPLLGLVAGLRDQKGLPTLLDALELLAGEDRAPRFAIIGNGPLRAEVEARLSAGRLSATTTLLPFEGRVEPYLAGLDGFVLPSLWEGMPIAVLEAMAFGLPVISTTVNGIPEALEEGEAGLLVPPSDPRALAAAIARLAGDGDLRARLGAAARASARRRFGLERMVSEIEGLYARVAGARPADTTRSPT